MWKFRKHIHSATFMAPYRETVQLYLHCTTKQKWVTCITEVIFTYSSVNGHKLLNTTLQQIIVIHKIYCVIMHIVIYLPCHKVTFVKHTLIVLTVVRTIIYFIYTKTIFRFIILIQVRHISFSKSTK
jgi:hypothetical protein